MEVEIMIRLEPDAAHSRKRTKAARQLLLVLAAHLLRASAEIDGGPEPDREPRRGQPPVRNVLDAAGAREADRREGALRMRRIAQPVAGESVKARINRTADLLGWDVGRTDDIWYGNARRIEAHEMDQLRALDVPESNRDGAAASGYFGRNLGGHDKLSLTPK